jgi:hypothetical protein
VCEIFFSLYLCFKILTAPVIEKSMLEIINYLLCIPIAGCCALSTYLWWMREHELPYSWLTEFFIALATAQMVLIPIGVVAGRYKHSALLFTYIISLTVVTCALGAAGTVCMLFSVVLAEEFVPTSSQVQCSAMPPSPNSYHSATYGLQRTYTKHQQSTDTIHLARDLLLSPLSSPLSLFYAPTPPHPPLGR